MDLLKMAIDDPALLDVIFPAALADGISDRRKHLYTNLLVHFWRNQFAFLGTIRAAEVEHNAGELFAGQTGREYWSHVRAGALGSWSAGSTRERQFTTLLETAYQQAISDDVADPAIDPAIVDPTVAPPPPPQTDPDAAERRDV